MSGSIKFSFTPSSGGFLVTIDDPRWTVKQTSAGILIRPVPGADLETQLAHAVKAKGLSERLAKLRGELRAMSVTEVRALCERAGLEKKGPKIDLIDRLIGFVKGGGSVVGVVR